ncbi:hypothetical protein [Propionicimonas sp.]|uniref:hypothetical protein n=1 Tax=Propionicimonas sp. TaxID=1955623 RepID=UPI0039E36FF8
MFVDVEAVLDPPRQEVRARFRISEYPPERWWLHDNLEIVGCRVDGQPAEARRFLGGPGAPFSPRVHQIEVTPAGAVLELDVAGVIGGVEAEVNCLGPELTELALYVGWHPVFVSYPSFEFTLDLQLLGGGPVAVNAVRLEDPSPGRSRWRSASGGIDIAVVASPGFVETRHDRLPVRALANADHGPAAIDLVRVVGSAMEACAAWWRPVRGADVVMLALSPREGWPYSRLPLILLPGGTGTTSEALHIVLHETAHLWWRVARPLSADDWLNEGLAEYAANRLARDLLPGEFTRVRTAATLAELAAHPDDEPVIESGQESPARHRNRYLRPALAIEAIERQVGAAALDRVLAAWLDSASDTPLSTPAALAILDQQLGPTIATCLSDALTTPGWQPPSTAE